MGRLTNNERILSLLEDRNMKKTTLTLALCLLAGSFGLTPLHAQQCKVPTTGIAAVTGGYTVTLPPQFASTVPTNEPLRVVLRDSVGNVSSVAGPVRVLSTGQLWIQTSERFSSSVQQCPSDVIVQGAAFDPFHCLDAEFGMGCFLKWCAGTTYCLPGDGPGGMACKCV
jgi:hypothetical protein